MERVNLLRGSCKNVLSLIGFAVLMIMMNGCLTSLSTLFKVIRRRWKDENKMANREVTK